MNIGLYISYFGVFIMITENGKKIIKTYKNDYIKSQLKYIKTKITNAISEDYTKIHIYGYFDKDIEVILRNLGYDVIKGQDEKDEYIEISWGNNND